MKSLPETILATATKNVQTMAERAAEVDHRLREIIKNARNEFIECGLLLVEAEENALWAHLINPATEFCYQNFGEWAEDALSYGRATYMEAKRVVKEFPAIPIETLKDIPRCNFKHLRHLPESKQIEGEWIEAAKGPEKEFVDKIVKELPALHVEKKTKLIFSFYESAQRVVDEALDLMMKELKAEGQGPVTKEEALEMICHRYLENL